jgi:hypothetical protein
VECQLQQLINTGHIQLSSSSCASPSFIITKKEFVEWHLVIDYQALNTATVKNHYPLPCIEDLLDHLKGARFFTKMDLTTGYHQVHMNATELGRQLSKLNFGFMNGW